MIKYTFFQGQLYVLDINAKNKSIVFRNTPYLASIHAFEHPRRGWELNGSVVPSLTHSNNYSFDPSIYKLEKDEIKKRAEKDFNFAL